MSGIIAEWKQERRLHGSILLSIEHDQYVKHISAFPSRPPAGAGVEPLQGGMARKTLRSPENTAHKHWHKDDIATF